MSKTLIIAEKPSVALDFTRALGSFSKHEDYYESDDYVLCSAIGHLLELAAPADYEVKRGKWSFAHLPVIPPHFDLNPIEKTSSRLKLLIRLIKRKDVIAIVNACDAGREGELIFSYIMQHAKSSKPVFRLWLQSMTQQAIREGFANLRSGTEMNGLRDAAMSRSEADWLVGINGTRAMTAFNSKTGGFHLTTVGRVQTPTLAILVEREERIRKFKSRNYWEVVAKFQVGEGSYQGKWFNEKFVKSKNSADKTSSEENEQLKADRLWSLADAETIRDKCLGKLATVNEESKPSSQLSPLLFDLTSLQREANSRFGFSAKTTLALAQALYEKHKALTYPRTGSRYLPEDYLATARSTLSIFVSSNAKGNGEEDLISRYSGFAQQILNAGWVVPSKRIFNNSKVSDHFAIIPTLQAPKSLSELEQKLYDLVVKRFLAVFYPAAEYLTTTRVTRVESEAFITEGKILVNPGWLVVYGRDPQTEVALIKVAANEQPKTDEIEVIACQTKPPARFSEATLLSAMEGAGKMVDDEELRAAMADRGLGTPATRAQIIENLINEQYVLRESRELIPTAKAFSLLTLLRGLGVTSLISPELTGEWEWKLGRIERGELGRPEFMAEIAQMTQLIVERAKSHESDTVPGDFAQLETPCPCCGGLIRENYKKFQCQQCDYSLWKTVAGRQFEPAEMDELLSSGTIGPLVGFRNKMGRAFSAALRLNSDRQPEFVFDNRPNDDSEPVDFSQQECLGECPKCHSPVYAHGTSYICEKATGKDRSCDFRVGQIILQQPIEPEQIKKLLGEGRTNLLKGFVSSRTKRKFSAYLVADKKMGKIGFEFEKKADKETKKSKNTTRPKTKVEP